MLIVRSDENHDPVVPSKENRKPLKNPELQREVRMAIGEQRCSYSRRQKAVRYVENWMRQSGEEWAIKYLYRSQQELWRFE